MILNIFLLFFAVWVSIWVGNFATTFYYRIPRRLPINGRENPPMCSNCKTRLYYPDYGPLYCYFFKSKFCPVCKNKIPAIYPTIEIILGLLVFSTILINGISEQTVTSVFIVMALFLNMMLYITYKELYEKSLWVLMFMSSLHLIGIDKQQYISLILMKFFLPMIFMSIYEKFFIKSRKLGILELIMPSIALVSLTGIWYFYAIVLFVIIATVLSILTSFVNVKYLCKLSHHRRNIILIFLLTIVFTMFHSVDYSFMPLSSQAESFILEIESYVKSI